MMLVISSYRTFYYGDAYHVILIMVPHLLFISMTVRVMLKIGTGTFDSIYWRLSLGTVLITSVLKKDVPQRWQRCWQDLSCQGWWPTTVTWKRLMSGVGGSASTHSLTCRFQTGQISSSSLFTLNQQLSWLVSNYFRGWDSWKWHMILWPDQVGWNIF